MNVSGKGPSMGGRFVRIHCEDAVAKVRRCYRRLASNILFQRRTPMRNTVPLISFTFDDFPRSALHLGGAILQHYGVRGTYYASLGLVGRRTPVGEIFSHGDLKTAVSQGHEVGCHTFSHCHAWGTSAKAFEWSVARNRAALQQLLPGLRFSTLSYPISIPRPTTKRRIAKYFACCRGGGQTLNASSIDLNNMRAFFLEQSRDRLATVTDLIARACADCGWLIFVTHDVADDPSPFGCSPYFFEQVVSKAVASGARIVRITEGRTAIANLNEGIETSRTVIQDVVS